MIEKAIKIPGWMQPKELAWLAETAQMCEIIVEIGRWKGRSTRALGDNCHGVVYSIDGYFDPREPQDGTNRELKTRGAAAIRADSFTNLRDLIEQRRVIPLDHTSKDAAALLWPILSHRVDLIFIDGDHTEEGCSVDILTWKPFLRKGGILAGHDYGQPAHPGVKRAVDLLVPRAQRVPQTHIWQSSQEWVQ